jgi:hypothetical protein
MTYLLTFLAGAAAMYGLLAWATYSMNNEKGRRND